MSPRILMKYFQAICLLFASISALCCSSTPLQRLTGSTAMPPTIQRPQLGEIPSEQTRSVIESAHEQLSETTHYTQDYKVIHYPGGDMPADTGACTDVIIRAFRKAGVDLQKEVHDDMANNFSAYPQKWGLTHTDTNIDHRRVPNLQTFFTRRSKAIDISSDGAKY